MEAKGFLTEISLQDDVPDMNQFPFSLPAVQHLQRLQLHPAITFFVGENGSGKSTLIEAIALASGLNAEGGSSHINFSTQHSESCLVDYIRVSKSHRRPKDKFFLRAESFFNVATAIDEQAKEYGAQIYSSYGGISLHKQSHGESFMALLQHRFKANGLYILDEPEAALSPKRQLALIACIHDLSQQGAQFIIATHSPILLCMPNSMLYLIDEEDLVETTYEETEHFQLTKDFLNQPDMFLKHLLQ